MEKFGISQSNLRLEDERFLTGSGRYTDDISPEDSAVAVFVRSQVAHARITSIETRDAKGLDGVLGVYTAADFGDRLTNALPFLPAENRDGTKGAMPTRPILATDTVRYLGEPVAVVVAETRQQALDAAETVWMETEDLPVSLKVEAGGETIHPEAPENLAYDWAFGDAVATDAAFEAAAHTVSLRIDQNRIMCNSMEPRVAYAEWQDGRLHLCLSGQGVWGLKMHTAKIFGLQPEEVRVTNPDVGGAFGMKAFPYNEYYAIAFASHALERPVKWTPDRGESMLSDNACRDLWSIAEAAFDTDLRLTALRINTTSNLGAYNSFMGQNIQSALAQKVFPGVYDVQTAFFRVRGIYTNTTPVDAYRGAGRPEAIYVLERLMDHAARQLGVGQDELRRRNFISARQMPYRAVSGELYDTGDFARVLDRAEEEANVAGFAARKAESAKIGKLRGLGLCYYIESILGSTEETTRIEFAAPGKVRMYVGTQSNGQGHETVYRQVVCERLGLRPEDVEVIQGDSDLIPKGGGTGGSRSVTMQGNSILFTSDAVIDRFRPLAEEELEASARDLDFDAGQFSVVGTDRRVALTALVELARDRGLTDLLDTTADYNLPARSYPNGAHFCEVEVEPETGATAVVKYTVVDDFGLLMNPILAAGQVHGGVAQGLGQAITEHAVYDSAGQLLTGSFMDYAMPRAEDVPWVEFHAELVPSTANEIGMKGCGEAGTVGAMAAVMNAVQDAVWDEGVTQVDMPVTPLRMWEWLRAARADKAA